MQFRCFTLGGESPVHILDCEVRRGAAAFLQSRCGTEVRREAAQMFRAGMYEVVELAQAGRACGPCWTGIVEAWETAPKQKGLKTLKEFLSA